MTTEGKKVIVANLGWNPKCWRDLFVSPKTGASYTREFPGHESLNFSFNKKGLDNKDNVYGFVQWTNPPKRFAENGIFIFYSRNLDRDRGEIVGIHGETKILQPRITTTWTGFENNELLSNIVSTKKYSMLFPVPLVSQKYSGGKRLVGQIGFAYKDIKFAKQIIEDEIQALHESGVILEELNKLKAIYKFITDTDYDQDYAYYDADLKEQDELSSPLSGQTKKQIMEELKNISGQEQETITVSGKRYKRSNKIIALLKKIRDYKCQICETAIPRRNNPPYVEAAHIVPKSSGGPETPDNILILCPNHHKEFDLGVRVINSHLEYSIEFVLNGNKYILDLSLE